MAVPVLDTPVGLEQLSKSPGGAGSVGRQEMHLHCFWIMRLQPSLPSPQQLHNAPDCCPCQPANMLVIALEAEQIHFVPQGGSYIWPALPKARSRANVLARTTQYDKSEIDCSH